MRSGLHLFFFILRNKINIIHARIYIPALIGFYIKFFFNIKLIFDMRGFWIDERIEWNLWKKNTFNYFFFKYFEKKNPK